MHLQTLTSEHSNSHFWPTSCETVILLHWCNQNTPMTQHVVEEVCWVGMVGWRVHMDTYCCGMDHWMHDHAWLMHQCCAVLPVVGLVVDVFLPLLQLLFCYCHWPPPLFVIKIPHILTVDEKNACRWIAFLEGITYLGKIMVGFWKKIARYSI